MPKIPYSKRSDGRYYKQIVIGYDENGKRKVKTLYDRDWRELDKKVREFQVGLGQGKYIDKDITLGECIDLWWKTKKKLSTNSKKVYESALKNVQPINHLLIKNIKVVHLQNVYATMIERSVTTTVITLNNILKLVFDFAIDNNFISINMAEKTIIPDFKRNKRTGFSDEERSAILNSLKILNPFEKMMIMILYHTGMRRNEILALQKKDIVFDENYIDVNKTLVENEKYKMVVQNHPKSFAGERKIPLVTELKCYLKIMLEKYDREDYIFLTRYNNFICPSLFDRKWKNILKKINRFMPVGKETRITPHCFRHNFATDLIYAGLPLKDVQYIMGHERIELTMNTYADARASFNNVRNDIINKMADYWNDVKIGESQKVCQKYVK